MQRRVWATWLRPAAWSACGLRAASSGVPLIVSRGVTGLAKLPGVTIEGQPQWETGGTSVLKPKYRLRARALRQVVREAESLGYIVLRNRPRVEPAVYPPKFKSAPKEVKRLELRKAKIAKGMEGMEKRRTAMHKKDRDERYTSKMKGLSRFFPEAHGAPRPKGNTFYKRRRALGHG